MPKTKGHEGLAIQHSPVTVAAGAAHLQGLLSIPTDACGAVLFAHGSGSSHRSPRNRYVAEVLNDGGLATLLIDLLTADEQQVDLQTAHLRFDIAFLTGRLLVVTDWLHAYSDAGRLPIGYFGASTGAAAALCSAAERPDLVRAVVSRGGRPDLAQGALSRVAAPTLLIVGGRDAAVIELNRAALAQMPSSQRPGSKELVVVPGATHLFEEPGALEQVAMLARDWFAQRLRATS
jgi:putative phosphoribosyl transferase